jgi:hypothetical protein
MLSESITLSVYKKHLTVELVIAGPKHDILVTEGLSYIKK